ncbi:hypothetical protein OQX61_23630 [Pedobacter sp. PLR]|uniref:hypothetical protein n=1 Tax=Pedobacter sp. PLR TaxID=2994465 RepID=UPI0022474A98|nr:hypothetical protein [Pedobacter sp. PLR]MCX2454283.1 hypothetical protein [Pedobacter sp. PLR]
MNLKTGKRPLTILLSAGIFMPGFSQYSVKVMVLNGSDNYLILNDDFVIRKQDLVQKKGAVPTGGRLEVKGLTAGRFSLSLTGIGYADYTAEFDLSSGNPVFDFGRITLLEKRSFILSGLRAIRQNIRSGHSNQLPMIRAKIC